MTKRERGPRPPKPEGIDPSPRIKKRGAKSGEKSSQPRANRRKAPTHEEVGALYARFREAEPMVKAILGQALVEHELDVQIQRKLALNDTVWSEMVGEGGPLRTFYAKIVMGHALKLYDATLKDHLHRIRRVRNEFAHTKTLLDFNDVGIVQELKGVHVPTKTSGQLYNWTTQMLHVLKHNPEDAFVILAQNVYIFLLKRHNRSLRASSRNLARAYQARTQSAYSKGVLNALLWPQTAPPPNALAPQIESPKAQSPVTTPKSIPDEGRE